MAELSKNVATALIDEYIKDDKKLNKDSKIVSNLVIDGA